MKRRQVKTLMMMLIEREQGKSIEQLMLEVKKVNGTFISLWHNESLKDSGQWLGWRKVFEQILQTGLKFTNEQS